jgi:hypothetical protein
MESGALAGAVVAAEQALDEAERAVPPGIAEVIEPARMLLTKVFSTYVGDLNEVPVMAKRVESISPMALDDRRRAVLALVDGPALARRDPRRCPPGRLRRDTHRRVPHAAPASPRRLI